MDPIAVGFGLAVLATLLGSVAVVRRLYRPERPWGEAARARLLWGVPWGSIVVLVGVCCVYLFVQDGITDFADPVTIPYRAWSYFAPLGMLTASFSHAGPSHLLGNLAGAAVVAPIAEYAWGHYPDKERGSRLADPRVRALVVFPLVVVAVGLATSLFALGPVIGFSGIVFAFAGFAIVHYPIPTLIGTVGLQGALLTVLQALQSPITVHVAEASPPEPPSWATIAIQGHGLGFFIGIVLGVLVLERRSRRPNPLHLWLAILLFGFGKSLWAIYWFGGENTFVLLRGPGIVVVAILAVVVTVAVTGSATPLLPRRLRRSEGSVDRTTADRALELARRSADRTGARLERVAAIAGGANVGRRHHKRAAFLAVLLVTASLAGVAVPTNLLVIDGETTADAAVEIEGYTVTYEEGAQNQLVSPVAVGPLEEAVSMESSGVIVSSDRHQVWLDAVSSQQLAFSGEETVYVGGPGWREGVTVERTGWEPVGNETVYQVWLEGGGEERQLAHESTESTADARIDDRNVTVATEDGEFLLEVSHQNETAIVPVPAENELATADGIAFEREDGTIYAVSNGTEVPIAAEETYD
ncbi:rhomboid family intramembrane serine protease [Natronococcus sp. A-GB1]|uniref:rhomboid family intramembrane serine protease n=1 Tax=Natronococcus sp. A-GB1 TaxID=3037648 RepID=UPI00241E535A|nr:rhomboid family intramembrane serine protease [Natronococcus sp. A-GB1]MDG5759396.1 rhomboid family intramembrane serine protease [Natronococcus sp. A-GB1]